jgi:pentatricopeptide repeat protein
MCVVKRFREDPDHVLRQQVAKALVIKGIALGNHGRFDEAVGFFDQVAERFGEDPDPAFRQQVG